MVRTILLSALQKCPSKFQLLTLRALRSPKVDISHYSVSVARVSGVFHSLHNSLCTGERKTGSTAVKAKNLSELVSPLADTMTKVHLSAGSELPPKEDGKIRLYGMRFCPFVQRIRIVLNAKGIAYEEVFVDLKNKPEWLFKLHPDGKVPALDIDNKILIESLDIAEFLDEKYPQPPLYPKAERKAEDKELIGKFGKVIGVISRAFYDKENRPVQEYLDQVLGVLEEFEKELEKRGTTFFSGDAPGMIDFMMWPWTERSKVPAMLKEQDFNFPKDKFPRLVSWRVAMQETPAVKDTIIEPEKHLRFAKRYIQCGESYYLDDEF